MDENAPRRGTSSAEKLDRKSPGSMAEITFDEADTPRVGSRAVRWRVRDRKGGPQKAWGRSFIRVSGGLTCLHHRWEMVAAGEPRLRREPLALPFRGQRAGKPLACAHHGGSPSTPTSGSEKRYACSPRKLSRTGDGIACTVALDAADAYGIITGPVGKAVRTDNEGHVPQMSQGRAGPQ